MNTKPITFLFGIVMVVTLAACQGVPVVPVVPVGNNQTQLRTIAVNGTGKVYLTPDVAYVNIGVQSQDENVATALSKNNEKAQSISTKLQELGVDAKDVQTSSFNIYPNQQYGPDGQPTKLLYTVDNTVQVTVHDLTILGKLLDDVVRAGANNINGINFDVVDRSAAESKAREIAVNDARAQADEIAQAAGVTIDELFSMTSYNSGGPVPLYDAKGGASAMVNQVPVSAGQLIVSVDVSASYTIK
jgi:uncharacterized protein